MYVDERPPPYNDLILLEHCTDLAKRLTDTKPSTTENTAHVTDQLMVKVNASAASNCTSSSCESQQVSMAQSYVTVGAVF